MKKILIGSTLSLSLVFAASPVFVGSKLTDSINELVDDANTIKGTTVTVSDYQSSWLSTTANITVELDLKEYFNIPSTDTQMPEMETLKIDASLQASHGLIHSEGFGLGSIKVDVPAEGLRKYLTWAEDTPFYQIDIDLSTFGKISYQDKIQGFEFEDESGKLVVSEYQGSGVELDSLTEYNGLLKSVLFTSKEPAIDFELTDVAIKSATPADFVTILNNQELYDMSSVIEIAKTKITTNNNGEVKSALATDAKVKVDTKLENNESANISAAYNISQVTGDDWNASDLEIVMDFNNLDVAFVNGLNKIFSDMAGDFDPMMGMQPMLDFAESNLLQALQRQPEFNLTSVKGTFPKGSIALDLNTNLNSVDALPQPLISATADFWVALINAQGNLVADEGVVYWIAAQNIESEVRAIPDYQGLPDDQIEMLVSQQAEMMIATFAEQNFLIKEGTKFKSSFIFKDKMANINGMALPLPF